MTMLDEKLILNGNKLIANFMGYIYFESGVHMDVGEYYKDFQNVDVYSKVPIEVSNYGDQKYFKDLPNPDFGNENSKNWRSDAETLGWNTLNFDKYTTTFEYHYCWDALMPVVKKIFDSLVGNVEDWTFTCESRIKESLLAVNIETLWIAIITFITIYNEKNKQQNIFMKEALFNPVAIKKGDDMYLEYFETECPSEDLYKNAKEQNKIVIEDLEYDNWIKTKKTLKVHESSKFEFKLAIHKIYFSNTTGYLNVESAFEKGIYCGTIRDKIGFQKFQEVDGDGMKMVVYVVLKNEKTQLNFDEFKKVFDESFNKVTPQQFIKKMENLGYKFKDIA